MKLFGCFLIILLLFCRCTKKVEPPKAVLDLIKKYQLAQEEVAQFEPKLKSAANDPDAQVQLNYHKELAKSRLERIKEELKHVSPETLSAPPPGAEGGGHGGGGGH